MPFVQRNEAGKVIGQFANLQEGYAEEYLEEDDPDLQPGAAEQIEAVREALQKAIDHKAVELGFSGGNALMLYAGFGNPYQAMAQTFAVWEASVWVEANAYKEQVTEGEQPMLSGDEAVAMMPEFPEL